MNSFYLFISLICHSSLSLQDLFVSTDNLKEIADIESKIEDFGKKKKSIIDQIKNWEKGASEIKVEKIEKSIQDLFTKSGELSPKVISRMIRDFSKEKVDPDYKMPNTLLAFSQIKTCFDPLFDFEPKLREFQARTTTVENQLLYNLEFNRAAISATERLQQKQPVFKRALIALLGSIQDRKQAGFDVRGFYFGDAYKAEERFIARREDKNIGELAKLYGEQKGHFLEEQDFLKVNYDRLEELFEQFYAEVLNLQRIYGEKRKNAELMDSVDDRILKGLQRMLGARKAVADIVALFRSQVTLIQNLRNVFSKIFETAKHIQHLNLLKKIQEAQISNSGVSIDEILQAEADKREAEGDAAEAAEDETAAREDAREQAEFRQLGPSAKEIDAEFARRKAERAQREKLREKRAELRAQRVKDRERKSSALKAAQESTEVIDQVSPEAYFRDKEFSDKMDKYAEGVQEKIDDGEISLADVKDTQLSEKIVQKQLEPLIGGKFAGLFAESLVLLILTFMAF